MFDAKQQIEALDLPKFRAVDGTLYLGELIGTDTWFRLQAKLQTAQSPDGSMNPRRFLSALDDIVKATFPRRPWWKFWAKDAQYHISKLPPYLRMKAIWDFMRSQGKALGMEVPEMPMPSGKNGWPLLNASEADSPTAGS